MSQTLHEAEADRLETLAAEHADLQAGERDAAAALLQSAAERGRSIELLRAAARLLRHGASLQDDPVAEPEDPPTPRVGEPGSEPGGAPVSSLVTTGDTGASGGPVGDREGSCNDGNPCTTEGALPCGHPQDAVRGNAKGPGGTRHCGICASQSPLCGVAVDCTTAADPLATTTQDRILAGAALGRARAAEPTECPDCGRTIARGQIPGHRGTDSCRREQERRARAEERAAVLAAPVSDAPPARPTTVILGGSTSRIVTCDLCGREMPQAGLIPHRGRGPCKERQAAQRAAVDAEPAAPVAQAEPKAAPVDAGEPKVVLPLSRPQRRPLRAEDVPSSIWGRQVQPGELRGVAVSVTRAIGAAPEVTTDNRLPRATEVLS
ncbi:MAG: hypothetical protein AMXMBFR64_57660 [Myxococcales bacterium]